MTNPFLFDRYRTRQAFAKCARPAAGETGRQDVAIIPGMTIAEPCSLARHWTADDHPEHAIAQLKMNGVRSLALTGRIVTREAVPLDCALHCRPVLDKLEALYGESMVFDAEYAELDGFDATLRAMRRGEGAGVMFLFDAVPYREWQSNRFLTPLEARLDRLRDMTRRIDSPFVDYLHHETISAEEVPHVARIAWQNGQEGIMVKNARSLYTRGRTYDWLKVKNRITREARIMDTVIEAGRCKVLICKMIDDGKTVRVGANIPEGLRTRIAIDPESFAGAVLELGATDTNDRGTLTGVYFITMRPDRA